MKGNKILKRIYNAFYHSTLENIIGNILFGVCLIWMDVMFFQPTKNALICDIIFTLILLFINLLRLVLSIKSCKIILKKDKTINKTETQRDGSSVSDN